MAVYDQTPDEDGIQSSDDELGIFELFAMNSGRVSKYLVEVEINSESINMEVDTAADFSIMSRDTYIKRFKSFPLHNTDVKLKTYTGETLRTCGQMLCKVVYSGQEYILPMIVAENEGKPTLLERNWLEKLKVNWNEVFSLNGTSRNEELDCILNKHADLFREGYDGMKGIEVHIHVHEEQVQFTSSCALSRMH